MENAEAVEHHGLLDLQPKDMFADMHVLQEDSLMSLRSANLVSLLSPPYVTLPWRRLLINYGVPQGWT